MRSVADYGNDIQAAIDAGPGTVYIPAGTYTLTSPLVLPRTTLGARGGVRLVGDGAMQTYLVGHSSFPANRGIIEWAPASGLISESTRLWRAWHQRIEGLTITMQPNAGFGIWYKRTTGEAATYEKMQIHVEDVAIEAWNNWPQVAMRFEGNVHDAVFRNVEVDIGSKSTPTPRFGYDALALEFDFDPGADGGDNGLDTYGAYNLTIDGFNVTPRSSGRGGMLKGRVQCGLIRNFKAGYGSMGIPQIHLRGSWGVTIEGLVTEGRAETEQVLIEKSRDITLRCFNLGTPDADTSSDGNDNPSAPFPAGDGIRVVDSEQVKIEWHSVFPAKSLWDYNRDAKRVIFDADCVNCTADLVLGGGSNIGGGSIGHESSERVTSDDGTYNTITAFEVASRKTYRAFNRGARELLRRLRRTFTVTRV